MSKMLPLLQLQEQDKATAERLQKLFAEKEGEMVVVDDRSWED